MALCRVWYGKGGRVFVQHVDYRRKPDDESDAAFAAKEFAIALKNNPAKYKPMTFEDVDDSQLPQDRSKRDKWRGSKGNGVHVDDTVILRQDIQEQLDFELAVAEPDVINVIKLQRKLDKREHD